MLVLEVLFLLEAIFSRNYYTAIQEIVNSFLCGVQDILWS